MISPMHSCPSISSMWAALFLRSNALGRRREMSKIRANGIEIEYEDIGPREGAPFLLIMGFGSQMTSWPREFRAGLADSGLRVITFDNRAVGLTQKWDGGFPDIKPAQEALREGRKPDVPYALTDMASDAASLLDELGIASAHIAGASMG